MLQIVWHKLDRPIIDRLALVTDLAIDGPPAERIRFAASGDEQGGQGCHNDDPKNHAVGSGFARSTVTRSASPSARTRTV